MKVVLAAPSNLEHELNWKALREADAGRIRETIEAAFEESLVETYFEEMYRQNALVCFVDDYRSVGVFIPDLYHVATLATHPKFNGNHLGKKLLMEILEKFGKFNLRSKKGREPANTIYRSIADDSSPITSIDGVSYNFYWKNHSPWEVAIARSYAESQPSHFKK